MSIVFYYERNEQKPKPGDLVFWWLNGSRLEQKFIGIILKTEIDEKQCQLHATILKQDNRLGTYFLRYM